MKKRGNIIYLLLGVALILEIAGLFYNSGIVSGVNERADKLKVFATAYMDNETILPGDIYDRNGVVLAETSIHSVTETADDGTEETKDFIKTVYNHGKAYSQLIGYTGLCVLNPNAESVDKVVGNRMDYRLMAFLDEDYWGENGLYSTVDIDGTKGQNAVLTIDHELQMAVYEALTKEMSDSENKGSAVVLDVQTGEILAMVSFPAYDFNELSSAKVQMIEDEKNTKLEPAYPVSYKNAETPGSIFKILTAVCLIDHGMEDFTVEDSAFLIGNWKCHNAYTSKGDRINYITALERSSNVFFAKAALELGVDRMKETAEKFGLSDTNLSFDFGNVAYNWDLSLADDNLSKKAYQTEMEKLIAQTGFGQGKIELTTIGAAMITQAIANDGVLMKPYLIKSLIDANGKTVYEGMAEIFGEVTSRTTADKVTKGMLAAAKYAASNHKGLGNTADIFKKYQVAGKTGTAENGDEQDTTNAWFVSFAPVDEPQYVVVVNQCRTNKGGYRMMSVVADIYEYLFGQTSGD